MGSGWHPDVAGDIICPEPGPVTSHGESELGVTACRGHSLQTFGSSRPLHADAGQGSSFSSAVQVAGESGLPSGKPWWQSQWTLTIGPPAPLARLWADVPSLSLPLTAAGRTRHPGQRVVISAALPSPPKCLVFGTVQRIMAGRAIPLVNVHTCWWTCWWGGGDKKTNSKTKQTNKPNQKTVFSRLLVG